MNDLVNALHQLFGAAQDAAYAVVLISGVILAAYFYLRKGTGKALGKIGGAAVVAVAIISIVGATTWLHQKTNQLPSIGSQLGGGYSSIGHR